MISLGKLIRLRKSMAKLFIEKYTLEEYIKVLQDNKEDKTEDQTHKENFLKFLSDSRDWAYQYIEDVQNGLTKFVNEIEPEISYFDEYGVVGDAYPHYHSMKKISQEYKELKKLLPVEENQ
jgi:hypothetical protein